MLRLNILLLLAVVICALGVVTSQHQARKLFQAMESEQERAKQLDVEYDQLQIELSTWATSPRIEKIAREKLRMRAPEVARVQTARPLSEFLFGHLSEQLDMTAPEGRARLASLARPLIERMPVGLYRELLFKRLAELAGLPAQPPAPPAHARRRVGRPGQPQRLSLIAQAIALLLDHPELAAQAAQAPDDWRRSTTPGIEVLAQLLDTLAAHPAMSTAALLERWREHPHFAYLQRLSVVSFLQDIAAEDVAADFTGALARLSEQVRKAERNRSFNQRSTADWSAEVRAEIEREAELARVRRDERH